MDEIINNTVDNIQNDVVDDVVEAASIEGGSSASLIAGAIAVGSIAVGCFIAKKLKIGDKINNMRVEHAKKILAKYDQPEDAVEEKVDDKHYTIDEGDK